MSAENALLVGLALGVVGGVVIGIRATARTELTCCQRVGAAVREEVRDAYGDGAAAVGDVAGLWAMSPALLDIFGVSHDA